MPDHPMAHPPKSCNQTGRPSLARQQRHARLAAELRSNLRKRKAQALARELDASLGPQGGGEQPKQPDAREANPAVQIGTKAGTKTGTEGGAA
jgi:hypothetical protein